jgi:hypothetical protein
VANSRLYNLPRSYHSPNTSRTNFSSEDPCFSTSFTEKTRRDMQSCWTLAKQFALDWLLPSIRLENVLLEGRRPRPWAASYLAFPQDADIREVRLLDASSRTQVCLTPRTHDVQVVRTSMHTPAHTFSLRSRVVGHS